MNNHFRTSRRIILAVLLFSVYPLICSAQKDDNSFCEQSHRITNTGMVVLGAWSISNLAVGGYGWSRYEGTPKYFSQMNFLWNTVNFGIAGAALYRNSATDCRNMDSKSALSRHAKMEKVLLINAGLDVAYMGTGLLLRHLSNGSTGNSEQLMGYGNSLLLQGGFLMIFDLALWQAMRHERLNFLENISFQKSQGFTEFQLVLNF
jgi:hypothetical protein